MGRQNKQSTGGTVVRDAEEELDQEAKATEKRTWTDPSTRAPVRAEFLGSAFGKVKLGRDGSVITVPMERLSDEDKKWISDRAGE